MSEKPQKSDSPDYSRTLYLPQTDFPMRAGLPQREPEILKRWNEIGLYEKLRQVPAFEFLGLLLAWQVFPYLAGPAFRTFLSLLYR